MNYRKNISQLVCIIMMLGCSDSNKESKESYNLGALGAFGEMIDAGVKEIALSAPLTTKEMDVFIEKAREVAKRNNVEIFREPNMIVTDLFPADITKNKEVLIVYKGTSKEAYLKLKKDQQLLTDQGKYSTEASFEIARRFGRMLSYSPKKINQLISKNTSFRTLDDFGIRAGNVFLYYKNLSGATDFYTKVLGLAPVAEYDNASILRIASDSYFILVDQSKGMHSSEEPKTVALALLTDQLSNWYDYLKSQNVEIKYSYKPKNGGPHDGFVAVDPEGYLLEFELFKQHQENEKFIQLLDKNSNVETTLSNGLGFKGSITWLYYKDLQNIELFFQNVLGLEKVADQGWTKIYRVTDSGYIGLVDERRGMHSYTEEKAVTVSFIIDELDGWFDYVHSNTSFELRSDSVGTGPEGKYRAFVGYDPEGYYLEFDRFFEHEDNTVLMKYLYK